MNVLEARRQPDCPTRVETQMDKVLEAEEAEVEGVADDAPDMRVNVRQL